MTVMDLRRLLAEYDDDLVILVDSAYGHLPLRMLIATDKGLVLYPDEEDAFDDEGNLIRD